MSLQHRRRPLTLILALVLAACSPQASVTPEASPAPTAPITPSPSPSPSPTVEPETTPDSTPATTAPASSFDPEEYTVKAGDDLYGIGRHFRASVAQLQAWNGDRYPSLLDHPEIVQPGWVLVVAGDPAITPLPAATATPEPRLSPGAGAPTPCRVSTRVFGGGARTYTRIPGAGDGLALTFDMGGRMDPALDIMDLLVAEKVCATIFATGAISQTDEGQAVLQIIKDHPELFEIGNHTMHHCDLAQGGGGSPTSSPCPVGAPDAAFIRTELFDAASLIRAATGQNPAPYWRPPYGSVNAVVLAAAADAGYGKTFMWDLDTIDWRPESEGGPATADIVAKVAGGARPGSIVLMHLGGYNTLEAVRELIPALRVQGYSLTSLSDLLSR